MYSQTPRKIAPSEVDDVDEFLGRYAKQKARDEATKQGVDPNLIERQFKQESAYKPDVIKGQRRSSAGAIGAAQLMPGTAKDLGVDPHNIDQNIEGGVRYMKQQLDTFGGDRRKALAAYNAGPGAVRKAGGVPNIRETQDYVNKIEGGQKDDVDDFLSRWKEPDAPTEKRFNYPRTYQGLETDPAKQKADKANWSRPFSTNYDLDNQGEPIPPPKGWPKPPRKPSTTVPNVFNKTLPQDQRQATQQAKSAIDFRPAGGSTFGIQQEADKLTNRVADSPQAIQRIAAREQYQKLSPMQRMGTRVAARLGGATPEQIGEVARPVDSVEQAVQSGTQAAIKGAGNIVRGVPGMIRTAQPLIGNELARQVEKVTTPVSQRIGRVADVVAPINPDDQSWLTSKIPQAAGSMAPFIAGGMMTGGSAAAPAVLGALGSAGQFSEDVERSGRRLSPLRQAAGEGMAVASGLSEAAGVSRAMNKMGVSKPLTKRLLDPIEEAFQEWTQSNLDDINAAVVGGYDPERDMSPFNEKKQEAAALGAILGGGVALPSIPGDVRAQRREADVRREQLPPMGLKPTATGPTARTPITPQPKGQTEPLTEPLPQSQVRPTEPIPPAQVTAPEVSPIGMQKPDRADPRFFPGALGDAAYNREVAKYERLAAREAKKAEKPKFEQSAFRGSLDDAKIQATEAENSENWEAARDHYRSAMDTITEMQKEARRNKDAAALTELAREKSATNTNWQVAKRNAERASRMQASQSQPVQSQQPAAKQHGAGNQPPTDAPTRDLTASLPAPAEPAPLFRPENAVNPEGAKPSETEQLQQRIDQEAAARQQKPQKRIITRIAEMGGINMDKHGGEMQSAKDARRVGLLRKKGLSPDLIAQQLREEGFDVDPNDLNTLWAAIDADTRGEVRPNSTAELDRRLADEEAAYEENRPVTGDLREAAETAPKTDLRVDQEQFRPDTADLREVREFGRRPAEEPQFTKEPGDTGKLLDELPAVNQMRQREQLPPVERRRALRDAVPKGQFGKISEAAYKRGDRETSLVEHPQLRKLLDLPEMPPYHLPDAEINPKTGQSYVNPEWQSAAQDTLNALAASSGKERSSQINFGQGDAGSRGEMGDLFVAVRKLAQKKGEKVDPSLAAAFKGTVEGARTAQRGYQEFSIDERVDNIRNSLRGIYERGQLSRDENAAHRNAFREIATEYGISQHQADQLFAGTKTEASNSAKRGRARESAVANSERSESRSEPVVERSELRAIGTEGGGRAVVSDLGKIRNSELAKIKALEWSGDISRAEADKRRAAIREQRTVTPQQVTDTVKSARVEYRSGKGGRPGTVYTNDDGVALLHAGYHEMTGSWLDFRNANFDPEGAERMAQGMEDLANDPSATPLDKRQLMSAARQMRHAAKSGETVSVVNIGGARKLSDIKVSRRHEHFHDAQQNLQNSRGFLQKHPSGQKMVDKLAEMGYAPEDRTIEAAAFVAGGQGKDFGLTDAEANGFLKDYFDDIVKTNGREALERFVTMAPGVQSSLKEAKAGYDQATGKDRGSNAAMAERAGSGKTGTTERVAEKGERVSVREQRRKEDRRVSFGELADEPKGPVMGAGFGALQKAFDKLGAKPKDTPKTPVGFDIVKYVDSISNQVTPKQRRSGAVRPATVSLDPQGRTELTDAVNRLATAQSAGNREAMYQAKAQIDNVIMTAKRMQRRSDPIAKVRPELTESTRWAEDKYRDGKITESHRDNVLLATEGLRTAAKGGDVQAIQQARRDLRDAKRDIANKGLVGRAGYKALNVGNQTARGVQTTVFGSDWSYIFRQGGPIALNPLNVFNTMKAFQMAYHAQGSETGTSQGKLGVFSRLFPGAKGGEWASKQIENHPLYKDAVRADLKMNHSTGAEEIYKDSVVSKLPWIKRTEAANEVALDWLRLQEFGRYKKAIDSSTGQTFVERQKAYEQAAEDINTMTGRTDLGEGRLKQVVDSLNGVLSAPRLNVSRIKLLDPTRIIREIRKNPAVGGRIAKDAMATILPWASAMTLGNMAGVWSANVDPDDPDFGKIRVGNTRYDVAFGLLPLLRLYFKTARYGYDASKDAVQQTPQSEKARKAAGDKAGSAAKTFARGRLGPLYSYANDLWWGSNLIGEPVNLRQIPTLEKHSPVRRLAVPVTYGEMGEMAAEGYRRGGKIGAIKGAAKALPGTVGIGVADYVKKPQRARR